MRKIYVISDLHLNHESILKFTDKDGYRFRGELFNSVKEMNERIIQNWNSIVKPEDIVYNGGDVYFGPQDQADKLLSRLNGSKRLLLGNHDTGKDTVLHKHFQKIMVWRVFKEFDCVLTHVPLHETSINEKVVVNIHGHIHQNPSPSIKHINMCVEWTDYKPVLLEELMETHKKKYPELFDKR